MSTSKPKSSHQQLETHLLKLRSLKKIKTFIYLIIKVCQSCLILIWENYLLTVKFLFKLPYITMFVESLMILSSAMFRDQNKQISQLELIYLVVQLSFHQIKLVLISIQYPQHYQYLLQSQIPKQLVRLLKSKILELRVCKSIGECLIREILNN